MCGYMTKNKRSVSLPACASSMLLVLAAPSLPAQPPMHLTLAESQKLAIQNHPAFAAAKFTAAAAGQVPAEYHAAYEPTFAGNITGVGADNGSRLAAGGLNNPVVYNRLGSGLSISQLITDFGRTSNLVASAKLHASAQDEQTTLSKAQVLLATSRAYFAVLRAEAVLKVANEKVTAREPGADPPTLP